MYICSIMPKGKYQLMYREPMVMLLTHLVEADDTYVKLALSHPSTYKILDNSLIELGGALPMERLVAAADKVKASEIILPDVFKDAKATVNATKDAIKWLKKNNYLGKYKLMAVCHGKTEKEFNWCFHKLNKMKYVDVIGIPKVMCSFDWVNKSRASLYPVFQKTKKEIHFLGVWENLGELLDLPSDVYKKVRSVDTCLFALDVIQNLNFRDNRKGTIKLDREYRALTNKRYIPLMEKFEDEIVNSQLHIK